MGALLRPDLPAGAGRLLNDALHDLHHRAGWPSLRTLARDVGVSHTTVSKVFSSPALPAWGTLEVLVEALGGDAGTFHDLWLAASTPTDAGRDEPRIAGRRHELATVRRHLEAGTGLLLVTGEAGIGKTRLVSTAARTTDTCVATGHCLPLSTEVPMLPVADALRQVFEEDGGARLGRALATCPVFVRASISRLVPEVGTGSGEQEGDGARQRLLIALETTLRVLGSSRPTAVLLEDLHWADPATLDLLEHLLGRRLPIPVVGTWRTHDDTTPLATQDWRYRVRRLADVQELRLGQLSLEETADQLALMGMDVPRAQLERIHARTRGQPLFTEQLAAHLPDAEAMPQLLADLLDRRLTGFADAAWVLLRTLGVADRPLTFAQLTAASGLPTEQLTQELRALQGRRLLSDAGDAVQLQHPLLADATRRRLVLGEAALVHRSLAEALSIGPDASAAEVAAHWQLSGDTARELDWRVAAARSAAALYDDRQEAEHWLRALEIWPESHTAAGSPPINYSDAYLAGIDSLQHSFQFDRAAAMSDAADQVLGVVDEATRAELLRRAAIFRGDREGAEVSLDLIDRALELYDRLPVSVGTALALDWKQTLLIDFGRFDEARAMMHSAVDAATTLGHPRLQRRLMLRLAWHLGVDGDLSGALATMDRANALSPAGSDPGGDIRASVLATDMYLIRGARLEVVEGAGQEALRIAAEVGIDNHDAMLVRYNVALARLRSGRVSAAARLIGPSSEAVDLDRIPLELARAAIDVLNGEPALASQRIEFIWREQAVISSRHDIEFLVIAGTVDLWCADPGRCVTRLLPALDVLAGPLPIRMVAPGLVMAARAAADLSAAVDNATYLLPALNKLGGRAGLVDGQHRRDPYLQANAATWTAELSRLADAEGVARWADAATAWDSITRPHDAAYCRWRAAQVASREGRGTVAARLLRRAAAGAREHVPLSEAISKTAAGAPSDQPGGSGQAHPPGRS